MLCTQNIALLPLDRPYWPQYFPIPLTPACRFISTVAQERPPKWCP